MAPLAHKPSRRAIAGIIAALCVIGLVIGLAVFGAAGHGGSAGQARKDESSQAAAPAQDARGTVDASKGAGAGKDKSTNQSSASSSAQSNAQDATAGTASTTHEGPSYEVAQDDPSGASEPAEARITIPEGAHYEPDVVLVSIADGATVDEVNALIADTGSVVAHEVSADDIDRGYVKLEVAEGASVEDAMNDLAQGTCVDDAHPNYYLYSMAGDEGDLRRELDDALDLQSEPPLEQLDEGAASPAESSDVEGASPEEEAASPVDGSEDATDGGDAAAGSGDGDEADPAESTSAAQNSADDAKAPGASNADAVSGQQRLEAQLDKFTVNDAKSSEQWALASMRVYEAWALLCSSDAAWERMHSDDRTGVAVIERGPFVSHEDLAANVVDSYDIAKKQKAIHFYDNHGTQVAGIISAVADNKKGVAGVSYNAKLAVYNVFAYYSSEGGYAASYEDLCKAYDRMFTLADTYNIRVVNMSLGAPGIIDGVLAKKIDEALAKGIVTVCSAGNDAQSGPYAEAPGDYQNAVSVINLQKSGSGVIRNSGSNYNVAGTYCKNISAPGTSILSTTKDNRYGSSSGTSFAAPQVTGVLALMFAANPHLSASDAVATLYATAKDLSADKSGFCDEYGFGEVDAYAAVKAALDGDVQPAPEIVAPMPTVTGAKKVPAGATAEYKVTNGSLKIKSGGAYAKLSGTTLTGTKAGTVVLAVSDNMGKERTTISVQVYDTAGTWLLGSSMNSNFVVDVWGGSTANGGNAILYKSNGHNNQVWLLEKQSSGGFVIRNAKSGKVFDVANGSKATGANVLQYAAGGKAWQRWKMRVQADNSIIFENENSGMALEVDSATAANTKNVRQAKQTGAARQKWVLRKVTADIGQVWDGEYRISSKMNTAYALDVAYGSRANGGNIILYKWNGGNNQRWNVQYLGKGIYKICNKLSGSSLDVAYGSLANGANICQWAWTGKANQHWNIAKNSDGSYGLVRAGRNLAVAVNGTTAANARNVLQRSKGTATNQRWVLQQF